MESVGGVRPETVVGQRLIQTKRRFPQGSDGAPRRPRPAPAGRNKAIGTVSGGFAPFAVTAPRRQGDGAARWPCLIKIPVSDFLTATLRLNPVSCCLSESSVGSLCTHFRNRSQHDNPSSLTITRTL